MTNSQQSFSKEFQQFISNNASGEGKIRHAYDFAETYRDLAEIATLYGETTDENERIKLLELIHATRADMELFCRITSFSTCSHL